MNPFKIIGWVGLAIAVVDAFIDGGIPHGGLLLLLLGLAGVLTGLSGVFAQYLPEVGGYLTSIFSSLGTFAAGAAFTIISRNIWRRYKP